MIKTRKTKMLTTFSTDLYRFTKIYSVIMSSAMSPFRYRAYPVIDGDFLKFRMSSKDRPGHVYVQPYVMVCDVSEYTVVAYPMFIHNFCKVKWIHLREQTTSTSFNHYLEDVACRLFLAMIIQGKRYRNRNSELLFKNNPTYI